MMPLTEPTDTLVVLNPSAGRSDPAYLRHALAERFSEAGRKYELFESSRPDEIMRAVTTAVKQGVSCCIAAGGDGTVAATASALVSTTIPLGIVPVGTGNALAVDLGIPIDSDLALDVILGQHEYMTIDAMQIGERYYFLDVGVGISALTMSDTVATAKRRFGRVAYVWAGLKRLLGFQPQAFALRIDGTPYHVHASEITVANGANIGGTPLYWSPHVRLNDGVIDVGIIRTRNMLDYVHVLFHLVFGGAERTTIEWFAARQSVEIAAASTLPVQGDGDAIGTTPVKVNVVPQAIRVIVAPS